MNVITTLPERATALLVLAHGAGAGMRHRFLEDLCGALEIRGIASLRYEFSYMEAGRNRVDPPEAAVARVREAVVEAARIAPGLPLFAGGKSFGGRMTSTAQAEAPLAGVRGVVFYGFPLHPPGRPGTTRADHLAAVRVPLLFVQGTRDEFARRDLLEPVVASLGGRASVCWVEEGDHGFKAPRRAGLSPQGIMDLLADATSAWMTNLLTGSDG